MIIYASRTGNVRYVCNNLDITCIDIKDVTHVNEDFFMFSYTDGIGVVPKEVSAFLEKNSSYLKGVIASGNTNFGRAFCLVADRISKEYNVPIIAKLDLRGTKSDREKIENAYLKIVKKKGEVIEPISKSK